MLNIKDFQIEEFDNFKNSSTLLKNDLEISILRSFVFYIGSMT